MKATNFLLVVIAALLFLLNLKPLLILLVGVVLGVLGKIVFNEGVKNVRDWFY